MAKKREVSVRLNPPAFQALVNASERSEMPKSDLVERLVIDYLDPLLSRILGGSQTTK